MKISAKSIASEVFVKEAKGMILTTTENTHYSQLTISHISNTSNKLPHNFFHDRLPTSTFDAPSLTMFDHLFN